MASADFSQLVVTTVSETACETSPVKVRSLSLHVPAAFTRTSSNFLTSVSFATLSLFPSLICDFCSSGQRFAYSFFQIPPHSGHPCCLAMCFVVAYAHSGLTPIRERPCWAFVLLHISHRAHGVDDADDGNADVGEDGHPHVGHAHGGEDKEQCLKGQGTDDVL